MYLPEAFRVDDRATIFGFLESHPFATVVTQHDGEPFASHVPLLLDRTAGPHGTILGHIARANPQWIDAAGQTTLVAFTGPHAYISPTWYAEPNTVPTWNYTAVHAYGRWETVDDPASLKQIVRDLTDRFERRLPQPWQLEEGPLVDGLVKQIVGFRIAIERLEAKFKLNQNHSQVRRERVVAALSAQGDHDSQSVAALMRR
jgi:transcriptional regulator